MLLLGQRMHWFYTYVGMCIVYNRNLVINHIKPNISQARLSLLRFNLFFLYIVLCCVCTLSRNDSLKKVYERCFWNPKKMTGHYFPAWNLTAVFDCTSIFLFIPFHSTPPSHFCVFTLEIVFSFFLSCSAGTFELFRKKTKSEKYYYYLS